MVVGCALVFEVRRREVDLGHIFRDTILQFYNVFVVVACLWCSRSSAAQEGASTHLLATLMIVDHS